MKQQFLITHRYTVLQQTEKLKRTARDRHFSKLCFHGNIRSRNFVVGVFWQKVYL